MSIFSIVQPSFSSNRWSGASHQLRHGIPAGVLGCLVLLFMGLPLSAPAQAEAEAALKTLHDRYVAGYREKILPPFQKKTAALDAKLVGALENELQRVTAEGLLDQVIACKEHIEALQAGKGLPAAAQDLSPRLLSLRGIYEKQSAALRDELAARTRPLLKPMDASYARLENEFTRKGAVEDARRIRAEREKLKTEGLRFLPYPKGTPPVLLVDTPAPGQPVVASRASSGENENLIDFRKLRRANVRVLKQDGRIIHDETPKDKDADRAVRVFATPHYSHYVTRKGRLVGHFHPLEDQNEKVVQVALAYKAPMALHENGDLSFAANHQIFPQGLNPNKITGVKSIASSDIAAAILFEDGRVIAWQFNDGKRPEFIPLKMVPKDLTTLWGSNGTIIGRRANGQFKVLHARRDPAEFEKRLNWRKLGSIDASPNSGVVLGIKDNGEAIAISENEKDPPEVPRDLGKVLQVRTGSQIYAAQREDGSWKMWGDFSLQQILDRINAIDRPVYDLSIAGSKVMWLE